MADGAPDQVGRRNWPLYRPNGGRAAVAPRPSGQLGMLHPARMHPEQGYRRCLGILSLSRQYGGDRVELACSRALAFQAISYQSVKQILKNNLDAAALPDPADERPPLTHENIRGAAYYASIGNVTPATDSTASLFEIERQ